MPGVHRSSGIGSTIRVARCTRWRSSSPTNRCARSWWVWAPGCRHAERPSRRAGWRCCPLRCMAAGHAACVVGTLERQLPVDPAAHDAIAPARRVDLHVHVDPVVLAYLDQAERPSAGPRRVQAEGGSCGCLFRVVGVPAYRHNAVLGLVRRRCRERFAFEPHAEVPAVLAVAGDAAVAKRVVTHDPWQLATLQRSPAPSLTQPKPVLEVDLLAIGALVIGKPLGRAVRRLLTDVRGPIGSACNHVGRVAQWRAKTVGIREPKFLNPGSST